jgi:hypothetical protein
VTRAEGVRVAHPLFQAGGGGSTPTSALSLFFQAVDLPLAKQLNALWHSRQPRCGRPRCRVAYAAECDSVFFAVAIWTNPIARLLPQTEWVELNRMAVAPDAPRNTASRMLAWMARDLSRRFPEVRRLISYQDCAHHAGTIYRAAGWSPVPLAKGSPWVRDIGRGRFRRGQHVAHKVRWEKTLAGRDGL